ncbi:hypothetical protein [Bacillus swezeyi]|uniref:Uncharacterized protein n=1 Tax=Bacillus swezeyi TaxID=1925020 RepID=A0A5M8RIH6_9BACI|nr:hypothetical protein [Bacillus swezeyi]KAA6446666.1 hypothetical protein DX927_23510 [Bacillus swezeyi]KAA6472201.1 hypothetical protein DX928_22520 [Bacillus swezeyi]TYS32336.1 hypothetical protein FZC77_22125 [Bacillus swezeyi]
MDEFEKILEYNTKNAGQQLLKLTLEWKAHIDQVEKEDIVTAVQDIALHMLQQWEKYKGESGTVNV